MYIHLNRERSDSDGWFRMLDLVTGNLDEALTELELHHRETGFIKDDLTEVERHVFEHPDDPSIRFRMQFNPKRARRFEGAGVRTPPPDVKIVNDGCFLCRENIRWQQQNTQVGLEVGLTKNKYYALMNPFPLMPNHLVIAEEHHISQEWQIDVPSEGNRDLSRLLEDLCKIAAGLPNHVGFYNGVGAGASIPTHLHFQFFRRLSNDPLFPLEQRSFKTSVNDGGQEFVANYPLEITRWRGRPSDVAKNATDWIREWLDGNTHRRQILSSNFIASGAALTEDVTLYFVPRDRTKAHFQTLSGLVGGLEVLGELVFSSSEDKKLLDCGDVDYFFCEHALRGVHTPLF